MTISGSATKVNVSNELQVNSQATAGGSTANLNLQGGTLSVAGAAVVGGARMDTSPTDISAQFSQSGGSFGVSGRLIIGQSGLAQSICNITGGTLNISGGVTVGSLGNAVLNVYNSGNVVISNTAGLSIGSDPTGATAGNVNLSSGTMSVSGDLILGNGGVGTLNRSGGVLTVSGSLVAAGAGTLVLNGSAGSVATYFGGQLTQSGAGTLVIVPQSGQPSGNEALTFGKSSTLTDGIVGPWAVRQVSGSNTSGDYLTLSGTTGPYTLATAAYTGALSSSSSASVVSFTGTQAIGTASAYAVKFGGSSPTTVNGALTLASGGMILNGATLAGTGSVNFGGKTGMVFAGSNTASTVAIPLSTTLGMVKFGPGTLILGGNNSSLTGGIVVNSGVLVAQSNNALGPGKSGDDVLVAAGAALELQGGVNLPAVEVSISGNGVGNSGGLCNLSGTNSLPGILNLTNNLTIATSGSLTLGPIQGSYNVTKTGLGSFGPFRR